MRRRDLCKLVPLGVVGLAGCTVGTRSGDQDESSGPSTGDGAGSETGDDIPTGTRTIPPYSRSIHGLLVENERTDAVEVAVSIRANESDESREVTPRLAPGEEQRYEDVDLFERAVTLVVRIDGETFRYVPGSDGLIVVTVTADGVAFDELVT